MNTQDKEVAETYALQLIARDPSRLDYALEVAPGSDLVREEFVEKKLAMLQQSDSRRPAASQDDLQLTARKLFEIAPTREDVQKVFIDFVVRFMRPEEVVSTIPDALHFNAACKELYFERVCGMKFTDASPDSHYSLALGLAKVGKARTLSNRLRNAYVDLIFQHVPYSANDISLLYAAALELRVAQVFISELAKRIDKSRLSDENLKLLTMFLSRNVPKAETFTRGLESEHRRRRARERRQPNLHGDFGVVAARATRSVPPHSPPTRRSGFLLAAGFFSLAVSTLFYLTLAIQPWIASMIGAVTLGFAAIVDRVLPFEP